MGLRRSLSSTLLVAALGGSAAAGETAVVDRIVGSLNGSPARVTLSSLTGAQLVPLASVSGVAIGFEGVSPKPFAQPIVATGRRLGAVLDALVKADPRYEWREDDGAMVIRPVEAWRDNASLLETRVARISLKDMMAGDALRLLSQMFGVEPLFSGTDSRRFSVEVRDGASLLEALNAIVRAHGSLAWSFEPLGPGSPLSMQFTIGGTGFGIPAGARPRPVTRSAETPRGERPMLERPFANGHHGLPLMSSVHAQSVLAFAEAAGVPIGFESLPASEPVRSSVTGVDLGGTIGRALDDIVAFDPRYEWRTVDGVIVIRPTTAWLDPGDPLFRIVRAIRLDNVTVSKALAALREALGGSITPSPVSDTRTFSIDVPAGRTVLDVLTAISRAHGELSWAWEETSADDLSRSPGDYRYRLWVTIPAGGIRSGVGFP
jgi:hypothetical protein